MATKADIVAIAEAAMKKDGITLDFTECKSCGGLGVWKCRACSTWVCYKHRLPCCKQSMDKQFYGMSYCYLCAKKK